MFSPSPYEKRTFACAEIQKEPKQNIYVESVNQMKKCEHLQECEQYQINNFRCAPQTILLDFEIQ